MDLWSFIASIPGIGPYLPYIAAFGLICAAVATILPPPKNTSGGAYALVYRAVNYIGLNIGHARNATDPAVKPPTP